MFYPMFDPMFYVVKHRKYIYIEYYCELQIILDPNFVA